MFGGYKKGSTTGQVAGGPRVVNVQNYILQCSLEFSAPSVRTAPPISPDENQTYNEPAAVVAVPIQASLLSLPARGGTFPMADYVGPELASFLLADETARRDPLVADLAAAGARSCQRAEPAEYAATVGRLFEAGMVEFSPIATGHPLGLFAVWKDYPNSQRLIVDARPANAQFKIPKYESTTGDDLSRMQVGPGLVLEAAKADLADFFHSCRVPPEVRPYFGLRPIAVGDLSRLGLQVPSDVIDARGKVHPYLTTCPMGWGPSPGVAQGAHEAVLYGAYGHGSAGARELCPVLDPAGRWSSTRVPAIDTAAAAAPHALVIDDLMLFRHVPVGEPGASGPGAVSPALAGVLERYAAVKLKAKSSKVHDYARSQVLLGYQLHENVFRTTAEKYAAIYSEATALLARGWAQPREVERMVGKLTHIFLLCRLALSVFSSVYAFARQVGHVRANLWPSVRLELRVALAILPLVRADVSRPVAPILVQTDASSTGEAAVYTSAVPLDDLRRECMRPRATPCDPECRWSAQEALSAAFEAPLEPELWKVAFMNARTEPCDIDTRETRAVTNAARWAARKPAMRGRRIVFQGDSTCAVGAIRKGRSSARGMLRQCRRLGAVVLAERLVVEGRWVPTNRNMSDRPSRGDPVPGPCIAPARPRPRGRGQGGYAALRVGDSNKPGPSLAPPRVRPRGRGQGGYAALRVGDSSKPGPVYWNSFWSGLLDANILPQTRERYSAEVSNFLSFVSEWGGIGEIEQGPDLDYWLAFYAHMAWTTGHVSKGAVYKALHGCEHWLPECKPLRLARRCMRGWDRLQPPRPAAPMPRDLALACAALSCLGGRLGVGVAMLVSYDCWLRISEVCGLTPADVVDNRLAADPVMRGVSVFLPETKTGRRQAVRIAEAGVADLLVAWRDARELTGGRDARLFPAQGVLRADLARAISVFDLGDWDTRGLSFVWHSFRHGGASRAFCSGMEMGDILVRGRWAVDSSGRHYVQAGRQMLLGLALPPEVGRLADRVMRAGLPALFSPQLPVLLDRPA